MCTGIQKRDTEFKIVFLCNITHLNKHM